MSPFILLPKLPSKTLDFLRKILTMTVMPRTPYNNSIFTREDGKTDEQEMPASLAAVFGAGVLAVAMYCNAMTMRLSHEMKELLAGPFSSTSQPQEVASRTTHTSDRGQDHEVQQR